MQSMRALTAAIALGVMGLAACSGDSTTGLGSQGQVSLSLASQARTPATARLASFDVTSPTPGTFTDGTNTLVLTKAQLVLRKIELKRSDAAASVCGNSTPPAADQANTGSDAGSGNSGSGDAQSGDAEGHDGHADGCEELKVGPVLLDVPVGVAGAQQSLSVSLDAGTYDKVEFQLHKPEGANDVTFLQANPTFDGVSIRVEGTWNGTPFTFTSNMTAEQELDLSPPLAVAQAGATDLTIFVDLNGWFGNGTGGLVDPSTANPGQPNETVVRQNIQRSFHAFEDENHDGEDDHGHHG